MLKKVKRYGMTIKVKRDKIEEYKRLHAEPWEEVLETLRRCNISNYSIHLHDDLLFGYLEYSGDNFEEDMKKVGECPITQKWWEATDPCQEPFHTRKSGEWWALMEEVFYME